MRKAFGHIRVSSVEQNLDRQIDALRKTGLKKTSFCKLVKRYQKS